MAEGNQAALQVVHIPVNIPLPTRLDLKGDLSRNFKKFKRMWENYELASRTKTDSEECQSATLLTCIGPDVLDIVDGLEFENEADRRKVDKILEKLEHYCIGETNETWERYNFNRRDQEQSESIDPYVAVLRNLAKSCNYGDLAESLTSDRMVMGICDNATRKRLLQASKLSLKDCIDICRSHESATRRLKSLSQAEDVQFVSQRKPNKSQKPNAKQQIKTSELLKCKFCGKRHEFQKKECPAWGKTCAKCKKRNHSAALCPGKSKDRVHMVDSDTEDSESEEFVMSVTSDCVNSVQVDEMNLVNQNYPKKIFATLVVNREEVEFQLDCGSTVNILPSSVYTQVFRDDNFSKLDANLISTMRM
ncbi:uncharacterized protein LOC125372423 [Haliotis rufescens]|uniref:uncharacterized protein LOC125372423 n=1 Tax=Haliotis rufescens TaxID=6454 RepID=UPI00201ECF23|nr:uncharacterized protein LOC125372423 [Haliotis rufescens]